MENLSEKYKSIIERMEAEIDRNEAKRLLMDLLEGYDFSNSTPEFKARCFSAVFYALEFLK
jgi:hypothetical protein